MKELAEAQETIRQNNIASNAQLEMLTKNLKEMTDMFSNSQKEMQLWKERFTV